MSTAAQTISTTDHTPTTTSIEVRFNPNAARRELARNWKWVCFGGVLSLVAGIAALLVPVVATAFVGTIIIACLAVVGATNLAGVFVAPRGLKLDSFLIGSIQVLTAAVIFFYPLDSVVSLTAIVAGVLMLQGVGRIALGWSARKLEGSGWMIASGVATVGLCCVIVAGLPMAALWVIGMMFGVEMISNGSARIVIALEGRRIVKEAA